MSTLNQIIILQSVFSNYQMPSIIKCPCCGEDRSLHCHGFYMRQHLLGTGEESIPRFKCLNPACQRKTFSILPFPYLRWIRHKLCHLLLLLRVFLSQGTVSALARWYNRSRAVIRRALFRGAQIKQLIDQELRAEHAFFLPWVNISAHWTPFTQGVSCALYPHLQLDGTIPHKSSIPINILN